MGIPDIIARKLTVPETITEWNIKYLKAFVERGPDKYPGANYVVRPDGKKKKITDETKESLLEEIQPGYAVERHLMDGDVAIFNRQPSLHRMSMMCHRIKVLPYKTLRLNPAVCAPYNADFDGDEMNLHIPQTEESRAEAEILMEVQTQMISPRYGLSIIGCVQDAISGNYLLTKSVDFSKEDAVEILFSIGIDDFSKLDFKKERIPGKDIFSSILPEDFNFISRSRNCINRSGSCENCECYKDKKCKIDACVVIKDGKLLSGVMDKSTLGGGTGVLLRSLHKKYGKEKTIRIIEKMFKLGIETLIKEGFTSSISDMDLPAEANEAIQNILNKAEEDVNRLIQQYHEKTLELFPGRTVEETLELKILEVLNKARNETGKVVAEHVNKKSHMSIMADSGSRGNIINLAQIAAVVGQQALAGKRIEKGFSGRTLSVFKKGDLKPDARGFIKNSFKSGLKPAEFFFAAMTGRDSLMDTALRTPKSGYLYRRLANAMQDLRVEYDNTVRDTSGKIVQFEYGEDKIDVSKSENGEINVKRIIG